MPQQLFANPWLIGILLNSVLLLPAIALPKKLLTPWGTAHAWVLGVLIWGTLGWRGYVVVMFYFLVGSGVTRIGMAQKEAAGIAEKRGGARGPENVWGSAAAAAFCALVGWGLGHFGDWRSAAVWMPLLALGYVASFATKLSDTTASEVGKAYGKRTFLITTLQPVPRGTEGAVSLEGTLAGMGASVVIATLGWVLGMIPLLGIGVCAIAAFLATNIESVIGATVQEQFDWLTNEWVNVINTGIGAGVAIFLGLFLLGA
ncbi:MAG: TIGR00297 family protein [Synechococcales cyanobacterium RU_4_20]|nr:TIGR00297 family protein [Synechococcales cyanobacterium RU_4_20]NJR71029.1 TIGR00297 family protein [Synechococcales cyanobacterium CRU_2_2]